MVICAHGGIFLFWRKTSVYRRPELRKKKNNNKKSFDLYLCMSSIPFAPIYILYCFFLLLSRILFHLACFFYGKQAPFVDLFALLWFQNILQVTPGDVEEKSTKSRWSCTWNTERQLWLNQQFFLIMLFVNTNTNNFSMKYSNID